MMPRMKKTPRFKFEKPTCQHLGRGPPRREKRTFSRLGSRYRPLDHYENDTCFDMNRVFQGSR